MLSFLFRNFYFFVCILLYRIPYLCACPPSLVFFVYIFRSKSLHDATLLSVSVFFFTVKFTIYNCFTLIHSQRKICRLLLFCIRFDTMKSVEIVIDVLMAKSENEFQATINHLLPVKSKFFLLLK